MPGTLVAQAAKVTPVARQNSNCTSKVI